MEAMFHQGNDSPAGMVCLSPLKLFPRSLDRMAKKGLTSTPHPPALATWPRRESKDQGVRSVSVVHRLGDTRHLWVQFPQQSGDSHNP